jgi:hypothetical protein
MGARVARLGRGLLKAGPRVRIRLPPAASQERTCLSREFAFLCREAAVFRGCWGRGERRGRQRRAGRGNIGPTGGQRRGCAERSDQSCAGTSDRPAQRALPIHAY